jgi:hypothetical protein
VKIVSVILMCTLLSMAVPCHAADTGEVASLSADAAVSVRLRRMGAEPIALIIVPGVTTRDQLLAVRQPRRRLIFSNGVESWMYPVEPTMRGPTIVPPDAELTLVFDAGGIVRKLQLHEPPLPRLALRNTPRPLATTPP